MAFATGTATNHTDFLNKLLNFLQTNATCFTRSELDRTVVGPCRRAQLNGCCLKRPRSPGTDQVLVGLRLDADVPGDRFSISLSGMTGVLPMTEFKSPRTSAEYHAHVPCQRADDILVHRQRPSVHRHRQNQYCV